MLLVRAQLYVARHMCVATLQLSLQPANCLALLPLGHTAAAPSLCDSARACALDHFSDAMRCVRVYLFYH